MNISAKDISLYIEHLIKTYDLYISIHGEIAEKKHLVLHNFHLHPFCNYIKKQCNCWQECIKTQDKVITRCANGAFFGTCYAGMGEYIYPITNNEKVIGFISVSGYIGNEDEVKEKQILLSKRQNLDYNDLRLQTLKINKPQFPEKFEFLIKPLVVMCEKLYEKEFRYISDKNDFITSVIRYVNMHHTYNLNMPSLSKRFHCSTSYLSHNFKKSTGKSISEYIEELRIKDGKRLLENTNLSITEISDCIGFCNSAYFSLVFKKHLDITPSEYRRSIQS